MEIKKTNGTSTYESKATEEQIYYLVATAQLNSEGVVSSINGGIVRKEQKNVASFNRYGGNLTLNFSDIEDVAEQQAIVSAINEFIEAIESENA